VLAGAILLVGLPAAVAFGLSWAGWSGITSSDRAVPAWVQSETVRATTSDGSVVTARVAIDAGNADTKAALESERKQVGLMLQNSVGAQPQHRLSGPTGLAQLSEDVRDQLNGFLESRQVPPVREVFVQDLLIKSL
jgi:flagellar basal body-associated protein FliL